MSEYITKSSFGKSGNWLQHQHYGTFDGECPLHDGVKRHRPRNKSEVASVSNSTRVLEETLPYGDSVLIHSFGYSNLDAQPTCNAQTQIPRHETSLIVGGQFDKRKMNALVVRKQSESALSNEGGNGTNEGNQTEPSTCRRCLTSLCEDRSCGCGSSKDIPPTHSSISSTHSISGMTITTQASLDSTKPEESRFTRYRKKFTKVASSQLGLLVMLVIYAFLGAAIFQAIEGPFEYKQKAHLEGVRSILLRCIWDGMDNFTDFDNFTRSIEAELRDYERELRKAFDHGVMAGDDMVIWDYWGSLFFSTTVFTTVGYGHIAPATSSGRIATMLYATLGIPLFFVVMANLGRLLTRFIKFMWSYVRMLYYTQTCRRIRKHNRFIQCMKQRMAGGEIDLQGSSGGGSRVAESNMEQGGGDTDSYVDYEVDDHFNLHPLVAITITITYIFFGALVYVQWETWTYLEAFYFIFVSVSTIGFGDLVPEHPRYFLLSSVYILLGLSLVAMVINVMMEFFNETFTKAKEKVENISKSIGFDLDRLESTTSKRKQQSNNKKPLHNNNTDAKVDMEDGIRQLGEVNKAFTKSEQSLNNNDICKDSGYAENTGSTCSSCDENDFDQEQPNFQTDNSNESANESGFKLEPSGDFACSSEKRRNHYRRKTNSRKLHCSKKKTHQDCESESRPKFKIGDSTETNRDSLDDCVFVTENQSAQNSDVCTNNFDIICHVPKTPADSFDST